MRWILYVDMDAFYVNCEVRERPDLAERPVIVGREPGPGTTRSVVLSASYEARALGVHSAQPALEAARRAPRAVWIAPHFPKYEAASGEVRRWLEARFGAASVRSIDEAAVEACATTVEEIRRIAREAQAGLREAVHLPSSWGVAAYRTLAKIASDQAKPGGIVVVPPDSAREFLARLPVRAIPGVGPKTAAALAGAGVVKIGDLAERRRSALRGLLGSWGEDLIRLARGDTLADTEDGSGPRSRSTDRTFEVDTDDPTTLAQEIDGLSGALAGSLAAEGWRYASVGVGIRWADFGRAHRSHALPGASAGVAPLRETASRLLGEMLSRERAGRGRKVRTLSVRVERLTPAGTRQSSLEPFVAVDAPPH